MTEKPQSTKLCPVCYEPLDTRASKCPRCGSAVSVGKKVLVFAKHFLEVAAVAAAIGVIYFMYVGNDLTRQAVQLTKESLDRVDSSLAQGREQLGIARDELNEARQGNRIEEEKAHTSRIDMEEKNRPRLEIASAKSEVKGGELVVYMDIDNRGFADASDVTGFIKFKNLSNMLDSAFFTISYDRISKDVHKIESYVLPDTAWKGFVSYMQIAYEWKIGKQYYSFQKYYIHEFDKQNNGFSVKILDREGAKQFWGK